VRANADALDRVEIEAADGDVPAFKAVARKLDGFTGRLTRASARNGFENCASD
jgi:hypothetical protein